MNERKKTTDDDSIAPASTIPDLDTFAMMELSTDCEIVKSAISLEAVDVNKFLNELDIPQLEALKLEYVKYNSYKFKDTPIRAYAEMLPLLQQLKDIPK